MLITPFSSSLSPSWSGSFNASYIFLVSLAFLPIPKVGTFDTPRDSISGSCSSTCCYYFGILGSLRLNLPVKGEGLIFLKIKKLQHINNLSFIQYTFIRLFTFSFI